MNTRTAIAFVALILTATGVWAADNNATEEENAILTLVLKFPYTDGEYTVVFPESGLWHSNDREEIKQRSKKTILERFQKYPRYTNSVVVTQLVDRLFQRNEKPVRLTIKSSPKDGCLIDFDGKCQKYQEKGGGGWDKLYRENPKAVGYTRVSLPVYDQKAGLVLVYMATYGFYGRAGGGEVILYRYEKGELKAISRAMVFIV